MRGKRTERKCPVCGAKFHPRVADVQRGWGRYCSKSCKAAKQEQRTGQYARLLRSTGVHGNQVEEDGLGWEPHKDRED